MRGNKKNSGLVGVRVIGMFMVAVKRMVAKPSRQRIHASVGSAQEHLTGVWENQELWRRRLTI